MHTAGSVKVLLGRNKTALGNSSLFGAKTKIPVLLNSGGQVSFFLIHQKLHGLGFPRHFSVVIIEYNYHDNIYYIRNIPELQPEINLNDWSWLSITSWGLKPLPAFNNGSVCKYSSTSWLGKFPWNLSLHLLFYKIVINTRDFTVPKHNLKCPLLSALRSSILPWSVYQIFHCPKQWLAQWEQCRLHEWRATAQEVWI